MKPSDSPIAGLAVPDKNFIYKLAGHAATAIVNIAAAGMGSILVAEQASAIVADHVGGILGKQVVRLLAGVAGAMVG